LCLSGEKNEIMKKLIPFLILLVCFASFTTKPVELKPAKTVTSFLKWYKENVERLNKINMVLNYSDAMSTNGKSYSVDFKSTEKYLTELKKSTFIGPKYIEKLRKYFLKCEEDFKKTPQKEGIPKGFESDLVIISQDYEDDLANLDKVEIVSEYIRSNNTSTVQLKFREGSAINYELGKENNKWIIQNMER
jgi:hypothetical protein